MTVSFRQGFILAIFLFCVLGVLIPQDASAQNNLLGSSVNSGLTHFAKPKDIRPKILKDYLTKHSSPLSENAREFVKYADEFNLDWRLVASIAGTESTFGKFIPANSYNAWGWGVYGNNVIYFSSWKEGIETVSRGLRENYFDKGAKNIYHVGRIYAESPNWPYKVNFFMEKIEEFKSQYESSRKIDNLPISL